MSHASSHSGLDLPASPPDVPVGPHTPWDRFDARHTDRRPWRAAPRSGAASSSGPEPQVPSFPAADLPLIDIAENAAGAADSRENADCVVDRSVSLDRYLATLVSVIFHLLIIILLGIWWLAPQPRVRPLQLITSVDNDDGDAAELNTTPLESTLDAAEDAVDEADPFDTAADFTMLTPSSVGLEPEIPAVVGLPGDIAPIFAGRDRRTRRETALREGGSEGSEDAVDLGLAWLAKHQNSDGSWSLDRFDRANDCDGQCKNPGIVSDTAATALALLPFLGAGETPFEGEYANTVRRGLDWLIEELGKFGDLRGNGGGNMYAHAQGTLALCEAYALTQDPRYREPAQTALNFIVAAQHREGGWRYSPGQPGDTSVFGWQIMALRSGQMAYLEVPQPTLDLAMAYLDAAQTNSIGSEYGYMPRDQAKLVMTAEALLCRQYLGWPLRHPGLRDGVGQVLLKAPTANEFNMYYWYYGTQLMHHVGGRSWRLWNNSMRDLLVSLQVRKGHETGSWTPVAGFDTQGGRLYMTALAVCTLEVYYRHMPLYRRQAVSE